MSDAFTEDGHAAEVLRHTRTLQQEARALAGELRGAAGELQAKMDLEGRMKRQPYATLAMAAGVGYVLGGGLLTPFTGRAVRWGVRLLLFPLLKNELAALGEAVAEGAVPRSGTESIDRRSRAMKMKDLTRLDKDDLLAALGLETHKSAADYLLPAIGIFGAGLALGAGLGLLIAPRSGRELRTALGEKFSQGLEAGRAQAEQARAQVSKNLS